MSPRLACNLAFAMWAKDLGLDAEGRAEFAEVLAEPPPKLHSRTVNGGVNERAARAHEINSWANKWR